MLSPSTRLWKKSIERRIPKKFLKELASLPSHSRKVIEQFAFVDLPKLDSLAHSGKIERMKGYPLHYKARFGDYRLGLWSEAGKIICETVLHRKDIYRFFP